MLAQQHLAQQQQLAHQQATTALIESNTQQLRTSGAQVAALQQEVADSRRLVDSLRADLAAAAVVAAQQAPQESAQSVAAAGELSKVRWRLVGAAGWCAWCVCVCAYVCVTLTVTQNAHSEVCGGLVVEDGVDGPAWTAVQ